jgi:hypothetical protein
VIRAIAVELSQNSKTGPVSTTYVGQKSCPKTCPFLGAGCYAEGGMTGFTTARLADSTGDARDHARSEATAMDALSGKRPLRLHVVGDARTTIAAAILGKAAARYRAKHSQPVWTYTHAWRDVLRGTWGPAVSVLASCETPTQVRQANHRGYAAALVVAEFPGDKRYDIDGVSIIPCPAQTRGVQCTDCRLCFDDSKLRAIGATIGFAAHGNRARKVRELVSK